MRETDTFQTNTISLSICVPAYNEEKTLREAVEDLLRHLSPRLRAIEVIIVNDGSSDRTSQAADKLGSEKPGVIKVIHHGKNRGLGASYRSALTAAEGDYFTWFPADHEDSAESFLKYLPHLEENTVITCHHRGMDPRTELRKTVSYVYTWLINAVTGLRLKYYNGLAVYPRRFLESVPGFSGGVLFQAELLLRANRAGYRIVEVHVPLGKRLQGKSKILAMNSFFYLLRDFCRLIKISYSSGENI